MAAIPKVVSCVCVAQPKRKPQLIAASRSRVRVPGQLDVGLLGYYPLGSHAGTDISGRGNNATRAITPVGYTDGILCEQAEVVDGRQHYEMPFSLDSQITVSIWIKPDKTDKREQTVLSVGDNLRFGLSWSLEPIIWINELAIDEAVISGDAIEHNKWTHLTFVRDDAEYRVYVNGDPITLYNDGVSASPIVVDRSITPGTARLSRYRDGSGLRGAIQDAVLRRSALQGDEIAVEYSSYCDSLLVAEAIA